VDKIINAIFIFDESAQPINENFASMGYTTDNILQTLDTILVFIIAIVSAMIFTVILSFFIHRCPNK
jgi:ABC-type phosphate/phosphonate transport system permease subunit